MLLGGGIQEANQLRASQVTGRPFDNNKSSVGLSITAALLRTFGTKHIDEGQHKDPTTEFCPDGYMRATRHLGRGLRTYLCIEVQSRASC